MAIAGGACKTAVSRDQKRDEARMLAEALLDAEVRIGELFKRMPKAQGARTDLQLTRTAADRSKPQEAKKQILERIGFSQDQAERLETLASHPDLVEQVKAEARENDDLPTRTAVLNLAKYREQKSKAGDAHECPQKRDSAAMLRQCIKPRSVVAGVRFRMRYYAERQSENYSRYFHGLCALRVGKSPEIVSGTKKNHVAPLHRMRFERKIQRAQFCAR